MKNAKLKKLASRVSIVPSEDVEILNPELQSGIRGGCFTCSKFECHGMKVKDAYQDSFE